MTYDEDKIPEILDKSKNIAVVGISEKKERDSYGVSEYLKSKGFNIIPINPGLKEWNGIKAYPDLSSLPKDIKIDIVDIFRKSDAVLPIVREAIKLKPSTVWMQEGVINNEAASLAKENGMNVVMDRCIMKEHRKLKR